MKNVIFFSDQPLYFGNTAGVIRLNHYAKALLMNNLVTVYQVPFYSLCSLSNLQVIDERYKVFKKDTFYKRKKGALLIFQYFQFLYLLNKFSKTLSGDVIFLYYPSHSVVLDLIVVFVSRYLYSNKIYLEVNEVPRYKLQGDQNIFEKIRYIVYSHLFEFTFKYYRGLLCISENIYHFYEKYNKNKLVIPILCSPDDKYQHFIYSSRVHLKSNPVIFLFSGTISIEKENLVELFKGFALFLQCGFRAELHFYGAEAKDSMKNITNLLLEIGIFDAVKFFGVYENKNVNSILRTADALLLPRGNTNQNFYGFSTKLSEYLVSGVPIIMTNIGEVNKYFLNGYNCILLKNFDSLSFYYSLIEFMNMSEENRKSLAINALQTAYTYFDFKLHSKKINSFLN